MRFNPHGAPLRLLAFTSTMLAVIAMCFTAHGNKMERRMKMIASAFDSIPKVGDKTVSPYFFVLSDDPQTDRMPLKASHATVDIIGVIADVQIEQVYKNDGETTLEAIYIFPASTAAAVHGMRMTVGERIVEAVIKKKKTAKKIYDKARASGKTASLLEQMRPNVFQMSVANILPGDEIRVEISYTELIVPSDQTYKFVLPTVVGPRYSNTPVREANDSETWVANPYLHKGEAPPFEFDLDLHLASGIPIAGISSPSHRVHVDYEGTREACISLDDPKAANRDFVLKYTLAGDAIESGLLLYEGEEENYFLLMTEPPKRQAVMETLPREYIFILDISGSMGGFPLDVSKRLISDILDDLGPDDYFNVLMFAGGSQVLSGHSLRATARNVERGKNWVNSHYGGGGTELLPALRKALALPRHEGTSRIVSVLTDGYITVEKKAFEIVSNNLGVANLFAFGIGTSVNRELIEGLARAGMGEPFVVMNEHEATAEAKRFRKYVSSPVLMGIDVEFEDFDAYDVEPLEIPDLFASRPVILFGKYRGAAAGYITVEGVTPTGRWSGDIALKNLEPSNDNEAIKLLWVRHRIRSLSDEDAVEHDNKNKREITRLGLDHNLLTAYTSFVAVDTKVRANGKKKRTVRQPLPLPRGVSDKAVGGNFGYGGLGLRGTGRGGGGTGSGTIGLGSLGTIGHGAGGGSGSGYGRASGRSSGHKAAPRVRAGRVTVKGSLDKNVIRRIIQRNNNQIKYCYEKMLATDPKLKGKVVVRFVIDANGKVTAASIASSTVSSPKLEACLLKTIKRLTFPSVAGGGAIVVNYPFIFQTAK